MFDLQLFSEEDGYSIDDAVSIMNGTAPEVNTQEEPANEPEPETEQVEEQEEQQEEEVEQKQAEHVEESPVVDFSQKVKFKANGQEVEKSIQDLINDAQLASNYNQKMQELATQRKAFDAAMQQQPPQQVDPIKEFEDFNNEVTTRAMKMLNLDNVDDFVPDATGIIGNKAHFAAYQKALLDVQQEKQQVDYEEQQSRAAEDTYVLTTRTLQSEPDFQEVNKYAEQALFQLPSKGIDGVKQFQSLYGTYQKIIQRDQYFNEMNTYGRSNITPAKFTMNEVKALTDFYNECKQDYKGSKEKVKIKEQVKAQVPKSMPIKPTVKVESTGGNETAPARKLDMIKIRSMDIDDIAKLL